MAKKKSKSKKFVLNYRALILIVVGLAVFGLAFIPATKIVNEIPVIGTQVTATNFYSLIGEAFVEGATTELLIMGISTLLTLICAGVMVVLGTLWMFGILNQQANLIAIILYITILVALITYLICFFVWKANLTNYEFAGLTISTNTPISTFVYFLLGVDVLGLLGHLFLKK